MNSQESKIVYVSLTNGAGGAEQILLMAARVTSSPVIFLKKATSAALFINGHDQEVRFLNERSILLGFLLLLKELWVYRRGYILISSHPYLNAYLGMLKRVGFIKSKLVTRESTSVFLRFSGLKKLSYKLAYLWGYPAIDLFVCQTHEMRAQLRKNLPFLSPNKVIVQMNPVDVQHVIASSEVAISDPLLNQEYICSAGRLMTLKGFDQLIRAFSMLTESYPNLNLVILGEGEERKNLQALIHDLNLQNKVFLKGFVHNPFPYFKYAKVCVVSSTREGFPNVLLQMMTLNGVVVSTLCADGIELFTSVIKVPINDVTSLSAAIKKGLILHETEVENKNIPFISDRSPNTFISSILTKIPD